MTIQHLWKYTPPSEQACLWKQQEERKTLMPSFPIGSYCSCYGVCNYLLWLYLGRVRNHSGPKHEIVRVREDTSVMFCWISHFKNISLQFGCPVRAECHCRRVCVFPALTPEALAHFISIIVILWLQDPWQLLHPTGKSYSFFFPIHHCHWRIDFSLLYSNLSQFISDCSMWNILISYHTAIHLTIPFLTCHQGNSIACFL